MLDAQQRLHQRAWSSYSYRKGLDKSTRYSHSMRELLSSFSDTILLVRRMRLPEHHRIPSPNETSMIVALLEDCNRYLDLGVGFRRAFEFLQQTELESLPEGRHDIDRDDVFAIVARDQGRGKADSPLEYHQSHADVQFVVSGFDLIGWHPTLQCKRPRGDFDSGRDLGFFEDRPSTWLNIPAGAFAVFYPEDAHAPLGSTVPIHKVVVKVRLEG